MEDNISDCDAGVLHRTAAKTRLVGPWLNTGHVVCAGSYFDSVETAHELFQMETRVTGVMKTAHRGFSTSTFRATPMASRGKGTAIVRRDERSCMEVKAALWVNRKRH